MSFSDIYLKSTPDDDGDGDCGGRISQSHPSPILHAPRDNISRKDKILTPIYIYVYMAVAD
jgi:hypothetical protein